MLFGPPAKCQLCGAFYIADQKQPTGGCEEEEVALSNRRLLHSGAVRQTTKEVHAMSTTQRLSSLLVATMFMVLLALMVTFGVRSAEAAQPVGECPTGYELVRNKVVLKGANLEEPDPSMDGNGDGYTCLKILDTGSGTRATWHDNTL